MILNWRTPPVSTQPIYPSQCCKPQTGRTISPVSGVVVAVAGMAKISPFEVVKRTSVPVIVGLLIVIIATEIMVPAPLPALLAADSR